MEQVSHVADDAVAADRPAWVHCLHATEGWSFCSWYDPSIHSVHSVAVVANAFPDVQNLQDGLAWVFCGWCFPLVHGVQVKVSVMVPALQLRWPDPW